VVVFVTHQTALVVWNSDVCAGSIYLFSSNFYFSLVENLCIIIEDSRSLF
jgi:hypothetical protein